MLTQESCPAGHDLECRYTHIVPCKRIPQKFSDGCFGATRRHGLSILPRLPACAVSASSEPSVYKCGKCLRNPDWQVMFDHEPEKAVATRRRLRGGIHHGSGLAGSA